MLIRIEFFGIARSRAGVSDCELSFSSDELVSLGKVLEELATRFPQLAGECIVGRELAAAFTMNLNAARFIRATETPLHDGDCLLFLSADAGG